MLLNSLSPYTVQVLSHGNGATHVGKSSHVNEHDQANPPPQVCSEGWLPLIPASVEWTEANTSEIHSS